MHPHTRKAIDKLAAEHLPYMALRAKIWDHGKAVTLYNDDIDDKVSVFEVDGGWIIAWEDKQGNLRSNDLPARRKSNTYQYTVAYWAQQLADAGIRKYRSATDALREAIAREYW